MGDGPLDRAWSSGMSQRANDLLQRLRLYSAAVVALGGVLTAGCSHQRTLDEVQLQDKGAPSYTAAVFIRPESMMHGRRGHRGGFEAAYERYRGDDTQEVGIDHYVSLNGADIDGPQIAMTSVKIDHGHFGYNHLFRMGSHFELEPMLGVSFDQMKVTAQGSVPGSRLLTEEVERWGLLIAVTPRYNFNQYIGIETRVSGGSDFKSGGVASIGFSLVARPAAGVTLKVGHYSRSQEIEPLRPGSDLDTGLQGFSGTVAFDFR
jgi:hypothetical protein